MRMQLQCCCRRDWRTYPTSGCQRRYEEALQGGYIMYAFWVIMVAGRSCLHLGSGGHVLAHITPTGANTNVVWAVNSLSTV